METRCSYANIPELDWVCGYPVMILISVLVVFACIIFFKRRHYWQRLQTSLSKKKRNKSLK